MLNASCNVTNIFWFFCAIRIGGVTIMRKGKADVICDGKTGIVDSCLIKRLETLGTNTISLFQYIFIFLFLKWRKWVLLVPQGDVVVKGTSFLEGRLRSKSWMLVIPFANYTLTCLSYNCSSNIRCTLRLPVLLSNNCIPVHYISFLLLLSESNAILPVNVAHFF